MQILSTRRCPVFLSVRNSRRCIVALIETTSLLLIRGPNILCCFSSSRFGAVDQELIVAALCKVSDRAEIVCPSTRTVSVYNNQHFGYHNRHMQSQADSDSEEISQENTGQQRTDQSRSGSCSPVLAWSFSRSALAFHPLRRKASHITTTFGST